MADALDGTPYRVLHRPTGVRLAPVEDGSDRTELEPDIIVVFARSTQCEYGFGGVIKLVVETASLTSLLADCFHKFGVYGRTSGGYWVVFPEHRFMLEVGGALPMYYA